MNRVESVFAKFERLRQAERVLFKTKLNQTNVNEGLAVQTKHFLIQDSDGQFSHVVDEILIETFSCRI